MTGARGAICLVVCLMVNVAAPQKPSVAVLIETPTSTVRSGVAIRIDVTITNLTGHEVEVARSPGQAEAANHVKVTDSDGRMLPRKRRAPGGGISGIPLDPGKSVRDSFVLNDFVDLNKPGRYTVQVYHEDWSVDKKKHDLDGTVTLSNTLVITVIE